MEDPSRVGDLAAILGLTDIKTLTIPGSPHPKSRPRFSAQGHAYRDPKDRAAERLTGLWLRRLTPMPYLGNVGLVCVFYRADRTRADNDNFLKTVADSSNGILWVDDCQVTLMLGIVELDRANPRTEIAIGEHVSSLKRQLARPALR